MAATSITGPCPRAGDIAGDEGGPATPGQPVRCRGQGARDTVQGMARGRGSSSGGEAVVAAVLAVVVGPFFVAYQHAGCAVAMIALTALLALILFRPKPSSSTINAWVHQHPVLTGCVLLLVGGEAIAGLLYGTTARDEEAARASRAAALERELEASQRATASREAMAQREREAVERTERERRAAEREADARRTPDQRATLVTRLLSGDAVDLTAKLCRAREILAPLTSDQRRLPLIRAAVRRLRAVERLALRQAREDAQGGRMIRCCDGSSSPTCTCNRSNRRGCCSHHGGICGCEPLPTEIACSPR